MWPCHNYCNALWRICGGTSLRTLAKRRCGKCVGGYVARPENTCGASRWTEMEPPTKALARALSPSSASMVKFFPWNPPPECVSSAHSPAPRLGGCGGHGPWSTATLPRTRSWTPSAGSLWAAKPRRAQGWSMLNLKGWEAQKHKRHRSILFTKYIPGKHQLFDSAQKIYGKPPLGFRLRKPNLSCLIISCHIIGMVSIFENHPRFLHTQGCLKFHQKSFGLTRLRSKMWILLVSPQRLKIQYTIYQK